ncbi:MAG: DUF4340 domain-containing protein [Bdellovibrionales bacterium]|nr:DUF4340 domain-containing protein [Bdellovibrionales bacterium]
MEQTTTPMYGLTWKRQLMLAAALLGLGGVAMLYEYVYKPKQEENEELSKKILPFNDAPVDSIAVTGGQVPVRVRCSSTDKGMCKAGDQSTWSMEEPIKATADKANVNSFLSTLKHLSATETVNLKEEPAEKRAKLLLEYGVSESARKDPKTRRVELTLKDGRKYVAWFGNPHPIGEKIFSVSERDGKLDDSQVYLVPSYVKSNFEKDLTYWRDKSLITVAAHRVESFTLKNDHLEAEIIKIKGGWDIQLKSGGAPGLYAGDLENIDALVTSANYLRAKTFAADAKESAAGRAALAGLKPSVTLTFRFKKGEASDAKAEAPVTLTLYEKAGAAGKAEPEKLVGLASNLDPVFELEPSAKARFNKKLKELRVTKLLSSMERFGAKKIEFQGKPLGGSPLALEQKGDQWVYAAAPESLKGKVPEDSAVQKLLDQMSANRIREFLDVVPAGEAEGLTVTITGDDAAAARRWLLWKHDSRTYARDLKSKRLEAFTIDSLLTEALPWSSGFFSEKPAAPAVDSKAPPAQPQGHGPDDGHGH